MLSQYANTANETTESSSAVGAQKFENQGRRVSSDFQPSLALTQQYDSNIYRQHDDDLATDDWVTILSPHLRTDIGYGIFHAILDLDYTAGRYADSKDDNFSEHWVAADLRWKPNHRNELAFIARFDSSHEDRGTELTEGQPDIVSAPLEFDTERYTGRYQLGTNTSIGRLVFSGIYYEKEYQNFRDLTSVRDYDEATVKTEFFWNIAGRTDLQVEASARETSYLEEPDSVPGVPDSLSSKTSTLLVGANFNVTGKSGASILVGYRERNFDDNDREDFTGPSWKIDARWAPRDHMEFTFATAQEDRETNGVGSFINAKNASVGWATKWNSRFSSDWRATYSKDDYQGSQSGRVDTNVEYRFEFEYNMRYWLDLGITFARENNDSDSITFDYQRNLVLLYVNINAD